MAADHAMLETEYSVRAVQLVGPAFIQVGCIPPLVDEAAKDQWEQLHMAPFDVLGRPARVPHVRDAAAL